MNRYELDIKEKDLNEQIAKILADERGLNWEHRGSRDLCLSSAYDIVSAWSKHPREPQTEIEHLCQAVMDARQAFVTALAEKQAVMDARQAFVTALAEKQAAWAAMREAKNPTPEPEPFTVLTFRDETTGKRVRLTVPTDTIKFL